MEIRRLAILARRASEETTGISRWRFGPLCRCHISKSATSRNPSEGPRIAVFAVPRSRIGLVLKTLLVWLIASLECSIALASNAAAARPNVLLIAIDDLNDWVGCLAGHPQIRTPHIDRLAKRGVLFTNAHCQAPICNPSRTSFFTGVLPSNSGVYDNNQMFRNAPRLKDLRTMPQHFRDHGYVAWGVGKLYHGNTRDPQSWTEDGGRKRTRRPPKGAANLSGIPGIRVRDFGPIDMTDQQMGDMVATQWAAGKLTESYNKPFFLALGITLPHVPLYAPRPYFEKYPVTRVKLPPLLDNDRDDLPPSAIKLTEYMYDTPLNQKSIVETDNWANAVRAYLACTSFVDTCVGRIIESLDSSPFADNTIIVLWSDHGWHLGEKDHWAKRTLWERSTHVPMIMIAPRVSQTGKRCTRPVQLADVYPTLVELCAFDQPTHTLDGHSLVPLLGDTSAVWKWPALTTGDRGNHAIRSEHWRYIRYADGSEELYDHRNDPNEWHNLASLPEHAEVIKRHARRLPKHNEPNAPRSRRNRSSRPKKRRP